MAEQNYLDWLRNQPHKPGDKITNWQKLTSRFLPPKGVKTWGEWYQAEGVTPVQQREEIKRVTSKQVSSKIEILKRKVDLLKLQLTSPGIGEVEKNRLIQEFRTAQDDLLDAEKQLLETEANEGKLKEEEANKRASEILRFDVRRLRERRELTQQLGLPTAEIDSELVAKEADLKKSIKPSGVVESSFGPPEVRGGQVVPGTGGAATPRTPVTPPSEGRQQPGQQPGRQPGQQPGQTPGKQPGQTPGTPPSGDKGKEEPGKKPETLKSLLKKTDFWYDLPDYIFETVPELGQILVQAVNEGWDEAKFLSKAKLTSWWQSKAPVVRQRIIDRAAYDELKAAGEDVTKSTFGLEIAKRINSVKSQAKTMAGVTLTDEQAQQVAEKIYSGNLDDDPVAITRLLTPFITKTTDRYAGSDVTTYGGQALANFQTLQAIAKANGLSLKDILPQISTVTTGGDVERAVLQGLAAGDIDINRVAQNARMVAAQGQPEYVRNLLNQGYDLEQVYAPYRNTMANVLEIQDPNQIDLNDPTLRSAINNNGDMNIYDFKKALRKDSRWQYTEGARQEMTDTAFNLLRNFGFTG